jgi:hypothetical protein
MGAMFASMPLFLWIPNVAEIVFYGCGAISAVAAMLSQWED